jgi:uncharacterized protein (TIGR03790 family)
MLMFWLAACQPAPERQKPVGNGTTDRVLVVINSRSPDGEAVGAYYMQRRGISPTHVVRVAMATGDETDDADFRAQLARPVREAIEALPVRIDFIVLMKGVPLRLESKRGYSVDAQLAGMDLPIPSMVGLDSVWLRRYRNPYYATHEAFNSSKFGMYLVTRIDCTVVADCMALVDHSLAAVPVLGPFFFDASNGIRDEGYARVNRQMNAAALRLRLHGLDVMLDTTPAFVAPGVPVMGYTSWGSNDTHFDAATYHSVRFLPGAIAETFVSTSAQTFGAPDGGQSRIADLVAQGVTGVKGYVSEPYTIAMADADILFDHYLRGFTLAESYYAASRMVLWKDVIIGDPLCAPYAMGR